MTEMPWGRIAKLTGQVAASALVLFTTWAAPVVRHDRRAKQEAVRLRWTDKK